MKLPQIWYLSSPVFLYIRHPRSQKAFVMPINDYLRPSRVTHIGISLFLLGLAIQAFGEAAATAQAVQAAGQSGLSHFLTNLHGHARRTLGLPDDLSTEALVLGRPILMHRILPAAIERYHEDMPAADLFTPTTQYYIPVRASGTTYALLIVDSVDGHWKAVSLGYPRLAAALALVEKTWPETEGFHVQFAALPQARQHVFTVTEMGPGNLTPLHPAPSPAGAQRVPQHEEGYGRLHNACDVLPALQRAVRANTPPITTDRQPR
jgi:hypothetical protein